VERSEVEQALQQLAPVVPQLLGRQAPSGFLRVVRRASVLREVLRVSESWRRRRVEDVIHVGIGGSSLGAETLLRALAHPYRNLQERRQRGGPRIHFVDNVDPDSLDALLEVVDPGRSLVHVVSKSGGTAETAAGFQVLRAALGPRAWRRRVIFTTGSGALARLARQEGLETLAFPRDIGGRFSVLTASGLLTPALAGVDVAGVVAGARRMLARVRGPVTKSPSAVAAAVAWLLAERRGKPIQVLMPYADALEPLARWNVQLVAESLGKRTRRGGQEIGVGPTPLAARGATDQHSQVQLFVDGPADKLVTFVRVNQSGRRVPIPAGPPASYLEGVELGTLLRAEQHGTAVALARAARPSLCWELPRLDAGTLGQLFLALEVQTACQAALFGVDAYDQPGVEAGKEAAFALIGREGYEQARAEIDRSEPPRWAL